MDIITLINDLVSGLLNAEEDFLKHLDTFPALEETVHELTNQMAAGFLGLTLTNADALIRESGKRRGRYTVQRRRERTLISSVGDVTFTHTLYKDREGKIRCLLDEMLRLPDREHFTTVAEAKILNEAEVHSYQHAAESIRVKGQTITKETVMNKVHAIEKEIPEMGGPVVEKKACEYLYIEADEDHIHRQKSGNEHGSLIGKLVYLFEGKEAVCEGRKRLISPYYFGGLYAGNEQNAELWKKVDAYIQEHYDQDVLKCVYINSDGGGWIRAAREHVNKSRLVADRFHLMKYINRVSHCAGDEENAIKGEFYKNIYKNRPEAIEEVLERIESRYEGSGKAVEECRSYLNGNWESIQRAFRDKQVEGCSAEGHISSVYSERMSSRPMGWSEIGSDRMCRLRCYIRNYGREKVIELVKYRREKELAEQEAGTGTEGMIEEPQRKRYTAKQREIQKYAEAMSVTLGGNSTIRKILAIREQIGNI